MPAIFGGIAQHRVLARDMREASEVGSVGELRPADLHALVAARADGEGIVLGDRAHRRLEQGQDRDAVRDVMAPHLDVPSRVRAAGPL